MLIIDLEVWEEKRKLNHSGMKSCTGKVSLLNIEMRLILLEEGMRRNCSPELPWSKKVYFLNKFSSDLKYSGHTISFRKTLLKRILTR